MVKWSNPTTFNYGEFATIKIMRNIIKNGSKLSYMIILLLACSCDIQKQSSKSKVDTDLKEQYENRVYRKGDTVTYRIPNVIYKDTVIYTVNRQGTTLKTVYDDQGRVSQVDCFASAFEESTKINRELLQTLKEKDKEKTEQFSDRWLLYIVMGVVIILLFKK